MYRVTSIDERDGAIAETREIKTRALAVEYSESQSICGFVGVVTHQHTLIALHVSGCEVSITEIAERATDAS